jgi:hypothetical protein
MTLRLVPETDFVSRMSSCSEEDRVLANARKAISVEHWNSILSKVYHLARSACEVEKHPLGSEERATFGQEANNVRTYSRFYKKTRTEVRRARRILKKASDIWLTFPPASLASWGNGIPQIILELEAIDSRLSWLLEGHAMGIHPRLRRKTEQKKVRWPRLIPHRDLPNLKCNAAEWWFAVEMNSMLKNHGVRPTHRWKLIEKAFDSAFQKAWNEDRIRRHFSRTQSDN